MDDKLKFLIAKWQVKRDYLMKYYDMVKTEKSKKIRDKELNQVLQFIKDLKSLYEGNDKRSSEKTCHADILEMGKCDNPGDLCNECKFYY